MNIHRFFLIISVLFAALLNMNTSFGMKCNHKGTLALNGKKTDTIVIFDKSAHKFEPKNAFDSGDTYYQPQTNMPLDRIIDIAACGGYQVKNNIQRTCKFLNEVLSKKDSTVLAFMNNPLFTASSLDLDDIRLGALWHGFKNKNKILDVINSKIGRSIDMGLGLKLEEDMPDFKNVCRNHHIDAYLEEKFQLNWKEYYGITENTTIDINELSYFKERYYYKGLFCLLYYAALSEDRIAMKIVSLKIKDYLSDKEVNDGYYNKSLLDFHLQALTYIAYFDKSAIFEFFVKQDPYGIIGSHYVFEEQPSGQQLFLDHLSDDEYISQHLKDKYSRIYQECCGKTFDVVKKEEKQSGWGCVIS